MYKQIVIARKDLNMSYGKFAAQVSHGSMAFLSYLIKAHTLRRIKQFVQFLNVIEEKI